MPDFINAEQAGWGGGGLGEEEGQEAACALWWHVARHSILSNNEGLLVASCEQPADSMMCYNVTGLQHYGKANIRTVQYTARICLFFAPPLSPKRETMGCTQPTSWSLLLCSTTHVKSISYISVPH